MRFFGCRGLRITVFRRNTGTTDPLASAMIQAASPFRATPIATPIACFAIWRRRRLSCPAYRILRRSLMDLRLRNWALANRFFALKPLPLPASPAPRPLAPLWTERHRPFLFFRKKFFLPALV